ncbi:MAG: plastocyanin/azurin family copper-binding protein [Actinomycetota bacterium]|nr:hypothetical protein [Actinomycetota bacterium]
MKRFWGALIAVFISMGSVTPAIGAPAVQRDIIISNATYVHGSPTANIGDTIKWINDDESAPTGPGPHTVTSDPASVEQFDSSPNCQPPSPIGCMGKGDTFTLSIKKAGSYTYHCKVHSSMKGTITVNAPPSPPPSPSASPKPSPSPSAKPSPTPTSTVSPSPTGSPGVTGTVTASNDKPKPKKGGLSAIAIAAIAAGGVAALSGVGLFFLRKTPA